MNSAYVPLVAHLERPQALADLYEILSSCQASWLPWRFGLDGLDSGQAQRTTPDEARPILHCRTQCWSRDDCRAGPRLPGHDAATPLRRVDGSFWA